MILNERQMIQMILHERQQNPLPDLLPHRSRDSMDKVPTPPCEDSPRPRGTNGYFWVYHWHPRLGLFPPTRLEDHFKWLHTHSKLPRRDRSAESVFTLQKGEFEDRIVSIDGRIYVWHQIKVCSYTDSRYPLRIEHWETPSPKLLLGGVSRVISIGIPKG